MDDDGPCADCFNLLQRRGPDPLKATKKDDDLWGGMERGGAWGVMHPPPPHVTMSHHSQLPAFTQPPRSPGGGAQYVSAQYHNAQALPPGEQMVPSPHMYGGVYVHQYHRHRGAATQQMDVNHAATPPHSQAHYSTGFQAHSQAHYYPQTSQRGGAVQYSPPSPTHNPAAGSTHTPSEPKQAWPRLPRVESPPVPLHGGAMEGGSPPREMAPAQLGTRTSSGVMSLLGSTSTKMDLDEDRDYDGDFEGDFDAKPGSSFGEALFAWGPPQPSRLQDRPTSPPPVPMETPVLANATDLGGLLSASWVEVPFAELELLGVIGEGAFGKVHKARWRGKVVAVKALSTDGNGGAMRGTPLEEFQKELATMAAVPNHPHVLGLLGASTIPPQFAIVTPYCARGSLYALLHSPADFLTWAQIVHVALGAALGMLHLHTHGILHRDLKSANLLCDNNLDVKVADFGLSRNISENTMTGGLGTFQWMAPEVLGHQRYSERADVYSFGIVLWECVSRKLPYADMNGWQAAMAVMTRGLRPTVPPQTPAPLAKLIQSCWAAVPTDRPLFPHVVNQLETILDQLENRTPRHHQPLPSAV